jgi:excisionase family DNA binding protein
LTATVTNCKLHDYYEIFCNDFFLAAGEVLLMEEKPGAVLTIEELAAYLKIPKSTLYKLVREGKIPSQKVGRHWRFHKEAIDQWLGNREADDANRKPLPRKGEI